MKNRDRYVGFLSLPAMIIIGLGICLFLVLAIGALLEGSTVAAIISGIVAAAEVYGFVLAYKCKIVIDAEGVHSTIPKKKQGAILWKDMKHVGYFRTATGRDRIMFFTNVENVWLRTNMYNSHLPLTKLIKMVPTPRAVAITKKYYQGEIIELQ